MQSIKLASSDIDQNVRDKKNRHVGFADNVRNFLKDSFQRSENRSVTVDHANYTFILSLFTIAFLLYVNTLANGFARDDVEVFYENAFVTKGIRGIPELLSTPHLHGYSRLPNETYRPLSLVFFAAEYQLFGANPVIAHLLNIVAFGLCVVLLFLFFDKLFDRKKTVVAFIAALIFAAHPIHTEVVANIKSFDALLCFLFAFLSLNIFMAYNEHGKTRYLVLGMLSLFLSFISKETVISFIAIVPLIFYFYRNEHKRRALFISLCTFITAFAFIALRAFILKVHNNSTAELDILDNGLVGAPDTSSKIATAIMILGFYLKLLLIPYPLICDYSLNSIPYAHFTDAGAQLSVAVYAFLIITAIYRLLKYKRDAWAFGILFFLVTIALFSNIFFLIASEMSERFTFFPSVGYSLIVALTVEKYALRNYSFSPKVLFNAKVCIMLVPLLLLFSFITVDRNNEWTDNYTLFKNDVDKSPYNSHLNYCMGDVLLDSIYRSEQNPQAKQAIVNESITYLRRAINIAPRYFNAQLAIAYAFSLNGQLDSAEAHNMIAHTIDPENIDVVNNLSANYFQNRKYASSLAMSLKSIALDSGFVQGYNTAGLCYYNLGKFDSGLMYLYKALNVDGGYSETYKNIALIYTVMGKSDSAKKYDAIYKTRSNVVIDL